MARWIVGVGLWPLVGALACYSGPSGGDGAAATEGGDGSGGSGGDGGSAPSGGTPGSADGTADGGTVGPGDGSGDGSGGTGVDDTGPPPSGPLLDRLDVTDVDVGDGVKSGVNNWRIWGTGSLDVAPVFTIPLSSCETLVGFTTGAGASLTPRVVHLDASDGVIATVDLAAGLELRGLAAESDGVFGALLWDPSAQRIWVRRFDLAAGELSSTELTNPDNTPTDFGIGDSRLEYGGGAYGAYYHVHSDSGHEGDTLKWVDAASGAESTGWGWGCSHSMSNLLRFNPAVGDFMPACVTDCYPGTNGDFVTMSIGGIYLDHSASHVMDVDGGCNGSVAGELGSAALSPGGWMLVFNAHQSPASYGQSSYDPGTDNQDIGLSAIAGNLDAGPVVWLTTTPGNEADASIARWQPSDDPAEQYVVGWFDGGTHQLARIDPGGGFLEGPIDLGGVAAWGRRDDPFRAHVNGDVVWAWFDGPGSTTLHVARLQSGGGC